MANLNNGIEITYLGHSTFRFRSVEGRVVLVDPWVMNNPACPDDLKNFDKIDIMAITHAHFDHIGDAVELGRKHNPQVVGIYETCVWLNSKGIEKIMPMNKGGSQTVEGIRFSMVHADHSCGIQDDDGKIIYGGEAVGYVIEFENGFKVYHAGDTAVFSDMKLISEIYKPELIMIPIGDLFTMSPVEAAYACRFLNPKYVIPMHYATFPALKGTPEQLKNLTKDKHEMKIIALKPGESLT